MTDPVAAPTTSAKSDQIVAASAPAPSPAAAAITTRVDALEVKHSHLAEWVAEIEAKMKAMMADVAKHAQFKKDLQAGGVGKGL